MRGKAAYKIAGKQKAPELSLLCVRAGDSTAPNFEKVFDSIAENPYRGGRLSAIDLLVLTSLEELLLILQTLFTFYETSYLNEEVNYAEPFPTVSVPY